MSLINRILKVIFDYLFALILILFLWPVMVLIAFLIRIDTPGASVFTQKRVGKNGKEFLFYKFRSMIPQAEKKGNGIYCSEDDFRITRIGKYLRKYSLDELPQLFNILKGEMSFVGPRPTLAYQAEKYNAAQKRRLEVKPGITGWAQVNGRNAIPWSKRIELDVWYIDHFSLWLDIKILFKTIFQRNNKNIYGATDIFDL